MSILTPNDMKFSYMHKNSPARTQHPLASKQWVLAPFEQLTESEKKEISSSVATAADVAPSVVDVKRLGRKMAETDHGLKTFKTTLLQAGEKRFGDI